ncbi:ribonuclease T [Teredinibacter sp. KSP-S5-2]|uniref:ribonuclease T n=1 Tax=Teredinibacter sp. KSP-S5-2 TaxID=3034506 RepID=UPI002934137D|nr:ribonuclease T [Teredinibacter sp. KSP-S5-2]WNO10192.1 ribonuclease T [Teredinibacter sp. KSP-S5-2]
MTEQKKIRTGIAARFRGFLPVVIDVETGGFNANTDALLEIAAVTIQMNEDGELERKETLEFHITPFEGANIEAAALEFTGIDLNSETREAVTELDALTNIFKAIRKEVKTTDCNRAVLVGHNAHFDLGFLNAAAQRCEIKRNPFHPFSCMDTATLSGLALGHTVLAKACQLAGIEFSNSEAHSAAYDAEKTADLYCWIVNKWKSLGGWPLAAVIEENTETDTKTPA